MITILILLIIAERIASITGLEFAFIVWLRNKIKRKPLKPKADIIPSNQMNVPSQTVENKPVEEKVGEVTLVE